MPNIWVSRAVTLLSYCTFFVVIRVLRLFDLRIGIVAKPDSIKPSRRLSIPSTKDAGRRIAVDVFEPPKGDDTPEGTKPRPVHINFHGSGFVLPCHGADAEICTYLSSRLGCIVLDADYAKAPFHPAPAALNDAIDVLTYVSSKPDVFDLTRVTLGGFSSGANIAILAAIWMKKDLLDVKAVVAWYPPTNLTRAGRPRDTHTATHQAHRGFRQCYLPPGTDATDPRISPIFAPSDLFPPLTLIVGEDDKLLIDSIDLDKKLKAAGKDCNLVTIPNAGHAWERFVKEGTKGSVAREQALASMELRLRDALK